LAAVVSAGGTGGALDEVGGSADSAGGGAGARIAVGGALSARCG
jgi:hypothetical protein